MYIKERRRNILLPTGGSAKLNAIINRLKGAGLKTYNG